jgi:HD-like signal output (HDOD) protein
MEVDAVLRDLRADGSARLPVLPASVGRLLQVLGEPDVGLSDVARVIETCPTIALRIVALANSAWSAPASPVTSLTLACGRLGFQVVRNVSIALALAEPFDPGRCPPFDRRRFWTGSLLRAEAATLLAAHADEAVAETARTAGLLSNLGLLWLADARPAVTAAALRAVADGQVASVNAGLHAQGAPGYDVAAGAIARFWGLPDVLVDAVAGQCRFNPPAGPADTNAITAAAAVLVAEVGAADWPQVLAPALYRDLKTTWPDIDGLRARLVAVADDTRELADALLAA